MIGPLTTVIHDSFEKLPKQLRVAARYIVDHPDEVALLSMREIARKARVQPATMSRLAAFFGFDGYLELRNLYQKAIRHQGTDFANRAGAQAVTQALRGEAAIAAEMFQRIEKGIASLSAPKPLRALTASAKAISKSRNVYIVGYRSSHSVAWHLHYLLSIIEKNTTLLDGVGGTGIDPLMRCTKEDVLVAISLHPYTKATTEVVKFVNERGVPIVAITDSEVSPLARLAKHVLIAQTEGPSFFHSIVCSFAIAEAIGTLVAGEGNKATIAALERFDSHLDSFGLLFRD